MDELIKRLVAEKLQLEEHMEHGELQQYIEDNADDLLSLFTRCIQAIEKRNLPVISRSNSLQSKHILWYNKTRTGGNIKGIR